MASVLEKIRVITLSNVHEFLDFAIDLNDVGALKQYARDLEAAVRQMEEFANGRMGSISTLSRDLENARSLAESRQADIDTLLTDDDTGNDHHALAIQVQLNEVQEDIVSMETRLADAHEQHQDAEEAISMMTAKLKEVVGRIEELEALSEETEALETGAEAMEGMTRAFEGSPSVDKVGQRIIQKNATARAQFDRAMGKASEASVNDATIASAEAALARRRQELAEPESADA